MPTLTMKELIDEYAPEASLLDSGVTRAIARKLRMQGYRRVRRRWQGKVQWVWTNEDRLAELTGRINDAL